ncbi:hypothetical protein LVJ94_41075 [Pendulispora rubella]|uniref:Uncharacterized protein n=1 Tax=Pendulispora rubella TaxID=2741070 RepID=A0ABZ2L146_9BACT
MAVVVALATWLVAAPVFAATIQSGPGEAPAVPSRSAPQCDQRGATTFAPTPTLDAPNASIDLGDADDCDCLRMLGWSAYEQGRAPMPQSGAAMSEAVLARVARVKKAAFVRAAVVPAVEETEHRGVRAQVERPPR